MNIEKEKSDLKCYDVFAYYRDIQDAALFEVRARSAEEAVLAAISKFGESRLFYCFKAKDERGELAQQWEQ